MSFFSRFTAISLLGASIAMAATASANLIQNGGFEQPDVKAGTWKYFSASTVDGWNGSNIEVWDAFNGVTAYEGAQHAELNAHPSHGGAFSIFQGFDTTVGASYDLSFAYRARQSNNESFSAEVAGINWILDDHTTSGWSLFSGSFLATSAFTTLTFTSIFPETGTVGNFLDDVQVTPSVAASVPAPASLALVAFGLLGLALRSRK
ncbi:PEP-CTERM sorting domain-containing protein [Allohahella marinimesophila]|uniref:Ice-binding protein C-terminal domain-containing protein n=1 Tax=Allohahella marinimesophila TaxID=1054972 RepID=A0ABP7P8W7_9GAMM